MAGIFSLLVCVSGLAGTLDIKNHYSPRNQERPRRIRTDYIILHTTEGPTAGSLRKVHERGEAHYFVDLQGQVYRIVDKRKVAFHAGRSMWNGQRDLDNFSIGIEVVGYYNRDITPAQYAALRELLAQLRASYNIPANRVLTHCMVAYGAPNRWHRRSHRGRKRCGLLFCTKDVRRKLGLDSIPSYDPDVRAGRLVPADRYLANVVYGGKSIGFTTRQESVGEEIVISRGRSAWDIAREQYRSPDTLYIFPDGKKWKGNEIKDWKQIPVGTRVLLGGGVTDNEEERVLVIGKDGNTARDIAGDEQSSKTTIYFLPDGRVRHGEEMGQNELTILPSGTRMLVGYTAAGSVLKGKSAFDICGIRWKFPSTFYRFPDGCILSGDKVDEKTILPGTKLFYRN
jgi:N-acetylmuramoyl-L-alanine amidase